MHKRIRQIYGRQELPQRFTKGCRELWLPVRLPDLRPGVEKAIQPAILVQRHVHRARRAAGMHTDVMHMPGALMNAAVMPAAIMLAAVVPAAIMPAVIVPAAIVLAAFMLAAVKHQTTVVSHVTSACRRCVMPAAVTLFASMPA